MFRVVLDCALRKAWSSLVTFLSDKELGVQFHFHLRNIVATALVALELKRGEGAL